MAAPTLRTSIAFLCVFATVAAFGQERSQYTPVTPSLTERISQMRENLFGDWDANPTDTRAQSAANSRGRTATTAPQADSSSGNQYSTSSSRYGLPGRGYGGTASMTGRPTNNTQQASNVQGFSRDLGKEELPSLARRQANNPPAAARPATAGDASAVQPPSRRSLQERLTATRQFNEGPAPGNGNTAGAPSSSRRTNPFQPDGSPTNVQHVLNPTVTAPDTASRESTSVARMPRPAVAGPVGPITEPANEAHIASSRRSVAARDPSERVASLPPTRDPVLPAAEPDVLFKRQSPLVSIETSGPRTIVVGKEATYTVIVQNAGDVAAQDVVVTIRVPEWADVVGSKESSGAAQVPPKSSNQPANVGAPMQAIQWSLARLEAKSKEQLSLQIVPRQSRPFDLAVQWSFTPITQSAVVQVQEPKLAMNLTGPADVLFGETKVYKMTLSNPGTGDAENVVIHLSPLTGQDGAATRHQIGTIKAGENKIIEVELTARQAGQIVIHASATADGGLQAEVTEEVTVRRAELEMKVVGSKARYAGTIAAYQIEIQNPGTAQAENVQIAATLPSGAKFVSASNGGLLAADGAKVQWTVPAIRAGGDALLELKCQVNNPGANRLAVQSTATGELSAMAEDVTQVDALADLRLDVVEPKGPIAVGAEVIYEIHVLNRGTKSANDVKVVGYFSGKIDPVAAVGGEHRLVPGIVIFKPIQSISAGGEAVFKVTARARAPGHHMFKAEVVCDAAGAKLGSEHTTLFYGDAVTDDAVEGEPAGGHDGEQSTEELIKPLAPKAIFSTDDVSSDDKAPTLKSAPSLFPPNQPSSASQKSSTIQPGSAYAPVNREPSSAAGASVRPAPKPSAPASSSAPVLPVSPFSLGAGAKK